MYNPEPHYPIRKDIIAEFSEGLSTAAPQQLYPLPEIQDSVNHQGVYTRPDLRLAPGVFLDHSVVVPSQAEPTKLPDNLMFLYRPGHRLGRENSHNFVFFGDLLTQSFNEEPYWVTQTEVAVKPAKKPGYLLGELAMTQYLREEAVPTFEPVGVMVTEDGGRDFLMTKFDQPIDTLDTLDWQKLDSDEQWAQVSLAVDTLRILHDKALFHGDLEFKNVAFNDTGEVVVVDPEYMVSARDFAEQALGTEDTDERARALGRLKQLMSADFTHVQGSVDMYIFGNMPADERPVLDIDRFKEYDRHIFKPYKAALLDSESPYRRVFLQAFDAMVSEKKALARQRSQRA